METRIEPRYTIEQIELLRRLLRTGLTKQDIVHALDTMTKLDTELCQGTSPSSVQPSQPTMQQQPIILTQQGQTSRSQPTQITFVTSPSATPAVNQLMTAVHHVTGNRQGQQTITVPDLVKTPSSQSDNGELKCGFENFDVADEEVNDLFRKGTVAVKEEIKNFLAKHNITQNQISHATGISQSYISQFLLHGFIMRQSTQELFYKWYLGKMKEMELFEKEIGISTIRQHNVYPGKNAHLIPPIRRRERFSWNEACLKVLESYWKKNPYPNDVEREKITEACNLAQQIPGEVLIEGRLVTPAKVYNWFANRRKDANRRKRMSGETGGTESAIYTLTEEGGDAETHQHQAHHIQVNIQQEPHMASIQETAIEDVATTVTIQQQHQPDQQQHNHHETVDVELEAVNNSIITLMQAVEEKTQEAVKS